MTQLLEQTIAKIRSLSSLPEEEQDRIAARIMRELERSAAQEEAGEPFVSAYDRSKHLAGIAKGGPSDVATNPKYMKGFGERSLR